MDSALKALHARECYDGTINCIYECITKILNNQPFSINENNFIDIYLLHILQYNETRWKGECSEAGLQVERSRLDGDGRFPLPRQARDKLRGNDSERMLKMKSYYVYILASGRDGTLYIGVTNNLVRRIYEHKNGEVEGFTKKYQVNRLIYYEETANINDAISREKQLKRWKRSWKIDLIQETNPQWRDLYNDIIQA